MNEHVTHGVRFEYPPDWELSEQESDQSFTVFADSEETSYWQLSLFFDHPSPGDVMESALEAYREEYEELDIYPAAAIHDESEEAFSGMSPREEIACEIEFVSLEMINSGSLRSFRNDLCTALVLYQGTDRELDETRSILERMTDSLSFVPDEE